MFRRYASARQSVVAAVEQPPTVRAAIMLMYGGAVLSATAVVLTLAAVSHIHAVIAARFARDTPLQVHGIEMETLMVFIVPQAIAVALWLWMAWANGRGLNWARVVSAALFGLWTLYTLLGLTRAQGVYGLVAMGIIWVTGLAATVLIFIGESGEYYQQGS
jgi:Ca2+/Na+ antiporter